MSASREVILRRIRASLRDVAVTETPDLVDVPRHFRQRGDASRDEIVGRFAERVTEYRAVVHHIVEADLQEAIAVACERHRAQRIVVPSDLPAAWLSVNLVPISDTGLSNETLDDCDGVLTGCALAIAQTGTIVLDGGATQGRRAITLIPDFHLCVVFADQIVDLVPEAITRLYAGVKDTGTPVTFISGPSATSDIELTRVEGVHGPRTLEVFLVSSNASG